MSFLTKIDLIVLFFFFGVLASWVRSDLKVPDSAAKFLSIFLLVSLGLKGGHEVRNSDDPASFVLVLSIGLLSCLLIPTLVFFWLKRKVGTANAAALAASYGSVSAVTLITAQGFLDNQSVAYSGYMVAVMAIMEIPAIALSIYLYARWNSQRSTIGDSLGLMLRSKSVVLLVGGFAIGLLMSDKSWASISPVVVGCFKGTLAFFLLDLGIRAQAQLREAWKFKWLSLMIACVLPLIFGSVTMAIASALSVPTGDAVLVSVLAGSASYIAAPAAINASIPQANQSLYVALPLALTFPMNVLFGIPAYLHLSRLMG